MPNNSLRAPHDKVAVNVADGVLTVWVGPLAHIFSLPPNYEAFGEAMHSCKSYGSARSPAKLKQLRQVAIDERAGDEDGPVVINPEGS